MSAAAGCSGWSVRSMRLAGLQFLVAKMDGVIVTVAHDKFWRMGLSGVLGFVGEGAVRVDVGDD